MNQTIQLLDNALPWFLPFATGLLGACVGSFLNVCIYRIPREMSVIRPRSHCFSCGRPLAWYDNLPILGWLWLRGRARCCGAPFSARYAIVEALTAAIFVGLWHLYPPPVALVLMFFASLLIASTFIDFDHMIIPDSFSIGGFVAGVFCAGLVPELHGFGTSADALWIADVLRSMITAIVGGFVGSALVYWIMVLAEMILRKPAMGEGDVKFMGAIGAFCGWEGAVFALFGGAMIGTLAYTGWVIFTFLKERLTGHASQPDAPQPAEQTPPADTDTDTVEIDPAAIPFGPCLAAGALVYIFGASSQVDFYFSSIARVLFP